MRLFLIGALLVMTVPSPVTQAEASCPSGLSLSIQAHQDDDILFAGSDLDRDRQAGLCIVSVYITAGDASLGTAYWQGRETGAEAAYASMAGAPNVWTRSTSTVAGRTISRSTLAVSPSISLLFLRLPDGNINGAGFPGTRSESLEKLWKGTISTMRPMDGTASYSKSGLTATLAEIMKAYQPTVVRTQDYGNTFGGGDHSDHYAAGQFALAAQRLYPTAHTVTAYMGYPISNKPENLTAAETAKKRAAFLAYAAYDSEVCQTAAACQGSLYGGWFPRQYITTSQAGGAGNIAPLATITASSQDAAQKAAKAADDMVAGWPMDSTKEWATVRGKSGNWINLAWPSQHTLSKVVLYDRPNGNDQVTAGTLTFSDGSTIAVGALPNDGKAKVVTFSPKTVKSLRFTATSVAGATENIGLAEIQAYETNVAPLATLTASSEDVSEGEQAVKAVDGYALGWPTDSTKEWATMGGKAGSWLTLGWASPQVISRILLFDRPNADDQILAGTLTFSDGSTITVPTLPNNGTPLVLTFPAKTVTNVRLNITAVSGPTVNIGLAEIQADLY